MEPGRRRQKCNVNAGAGCLGLALNSLRAAAALQRGRVAVASHSCRCWPGRSPPFLGHNSSMGVGRSRSNGKYMCPLAQKSHFRQTLYGNKRIVEFFHPHLSSACPVGCAGGGTPAPGLPEAMGLARHRPARALEPLHRFWDQLRRVCNASLDKRRATATLLCLSPPQPAGLATDRAALGPPPRAALAQGSWRVPLGPWPESEEPCPPGHHLAYLLLPLTSLPSSL